MKAVRSDKLNTEQEKLMIKKSKRKRRPVPSIP